jgi:hypothetical protein
MSIAISGLGHEENRRRTLEAGFHHVLVKPGRGAPQMAGFESLALRKIPL